MLPLDARMVRTPYTCLVRRFVHRYGTKRCFDYHKMIHIHVVRGSRGGVGGGGVRTPPPPEFSKLNIADITGNEKISYFSYVCTSTVIRQTESILLKVGPPPWKNFLDPRLGLFLYNSVVL